MSRSSPERAQRAVRWGTLVTLVLVTGGLWIARARPEVRPATYGEVVLEVSGLH